MKFTAFLGLAFGAVALAQISAPISAPVGVEASTLEGILASIRETLQSNTDVTGNNCTFFNAPEECKSFSRLPAFLCNNEWFTGLDACVNAGPCSYITPETAETLATICPPNCSELANTCAEGLVCRAGFCQYADNIGAQCNVQPGQTCYGAGVECVDNVCTVVGSTNGSD